jgi:hypothetical protein
MGLVCNGGGLASHPEAVPRSVKLEIDFLSVLIGNEQMERGKRKDHDG